MRCGILTVNQQMIIYLCSMTQIPVTKEGHPFLPLPLGTRDPVIPVLQAVQKLLQNKPNSSEATWYSNKFPK